MIPGFLCVRELCLQRQRQQSPLQTSSEHDIACRSVCLPLLCFLFSNLVLQTSWKFCEPLNILQRISLRFKPARVHFWGVHLSIPMDGERGGENVWEHTAVLKNIASTGMYKSLKMGGQVRESFGVFEEMRIN